MSPMPMAHRAANAYLQRRMAHRSRVPWVLRRHGLRFAIGLLLVVVLVAAAIGYGGSIPGGAPARSGDVTLANASLTPSSLPSVDASPSWPAFVFPDGTVSYPTLAPTPTPEPTPTPRPTPSPTTKPTSKPAPTAVPYPLPGLIGAIGDSYTQAYSTSPSEPYSHPEHSWAVGEAKGDGVYSLVERFEALGDVISVSDPAYPGKKMNDGPRQAGIVIAAAAKLAPGRAAFVTIALGTNDICVADMTAPATYQSQFQSTIDLLRAGLPAGSTIFVQTLVDFVKLRSLTAGSAAAQSVYRANATCPHFLGQNATPDELAAGRSYLAAYNQALVSVCGQVEATDGKTGRLHCRTDVASGASYFNRNFTLADFSTVDYFHPSLSGEGLMAASAWTSAYWSSLLAVSAAARRSMPIADPWPERWVDVSGA